MARAIKYIILHETATPDGRPHTAVDVDAWHRERGFMRSPQAIHEFNSSLPCIGYHYVIRLDGGVEPGRAEKEIPAACAGFNLSSINVCLVGGGRYTLAQWSTLRALVNDLQGRYPDASVRGHNEFATAKGKTCPGFSVQDWLALGMVAMDDHVLPATEIGKT